MWFGLSINIGIPDDSPDLLIGQLWVDAMRGDSLPAHFKAVERDLYWGLQLDLVSLN